MPSIDRHRLGSSSFIERLLRFKFFPPTGYQIFNRGCCKATTRSQREITRPLSMTGEYLTINSDGIRVQRLMRRWLRIRSSFAFHRGCIIIPIYRSMIVIERPLEKKDIQQSFPQSTYSRTTSSADERTRSNCGFYRDLAETDLGR